MNNAPEFTEVDFAAAARIVGAVVHAHDGDEYSRLFLGSTTIGSDRLTLAVFADIIEADFETGELRVWPLLHGLDLHDEPDGEVERRAVANIMIALDLIDPVAAARLRRDEAAYTADAT